MLAYIWLKHTSIHMVKHTRVLLTLGLTHEILQILLLVFPGASALSKPSRRRSLRRGGRLGLWFFGFLYLRFVTLEGTPPLLVGWVYESGVNITHKCFSCSFESQSKPGTQMVDPNHASRIEMAEFRSDLWLGSSLTFYPVFEHVVCFPSAV